MITLFEVNEQNYTDILALRLHEEQEKYLDRPAGILIRGYVYRADRARVIGIALKEQVIGVALVRDLDEEPACYDLQQFMIDRRFQNQGYGTEALERILSRLAGEGKYGQTEVCVNRANAAALRMFEKAGFTDTGYIDESLPDCKNLMYRFHREEKTYRDLLLSDFSHPLFQSAFRQYFAELGISVRDWVGVFQEMEEERQNLAFLRIAGKEQAIGFIQFRPAAFTSWFFEETCGFIREFWVAGEFRKKGHGTSLIRLAEQYFIENGICTSILTTDTVPQFYEKRGYVRAPGCRAKNQDDVFVKRLS